MTTKMKMIFQNRILTFFMTITILSMSVSLSVSAAENDYSYLLMPTQIKKINNTYFIVDCNHNQIIYTDNLNTKLQDWNVMTRNTQSPHALTSDGEIYMVADTDNNRILTFAKSYQQFYPLQTFEDVGIRPHFVDYDYETGLFYAWSSMTGEMYLYQKIPGTKQLELLEIKCIPELQNCYVRSFTLLGDIILFPAIERSSIIAADKYTFAVLNEYAVPEMFAGMVQISIVDDSFFITVSTDRQYHPQTSTVICAKNLEDFALENYTNLYSIFGNSGTPYFVSHFDGAYYMIHENTAPSIYRFHANEGIISDVKKMF